MSVRALLRVLAKAKPYLGLRLLTIEYGFFRESFLRLFIDALLHNPHSVIYEEIKNNQNYAQGHRYRFDRLNPVLWYFFGQMRFHAADLALWKPIGDLTIDELQRLGGNSSADPYRQIEPSFSEDGRWRSPIYMGVWLFDFLISEGLRQWGPWASVPDVLGRLDQAHPPEHGGPAA